LPLACRGCAVAAASGILQKAPAETAAGSSVDVARSRDRGKASAAKERSLDFGQAILFTNSADIVMAERHRVYNPDEDEEVRGVLRVVE
jgi:hypothetical protein